MPSFRQLISPYFLVHCAVLIAFYIQVYPRYLRRNALETEVGRERLHGVGYSSLSHEQEVCGMIFIAFCVKLATSYRNLDQVLDRILLTLQITSWILTWLTGDRLALLGLSLLYAAMYILLVPPKYQGDSNIMSLDSESFQQVILNANDDTAQLICCYTPWSSDCRCLEPIICQLSMEYGHLDFYSLDLTQNPELATELEIDMTTSSKQLPSLLLFYRGREVRRLPPFQSDGMVVKRSMSKKKMTQYFELDGDPSEASYRRDAKQAESNRKRR